MTNNKIEAIIFDLGGVILNLDYEETIKEFQKIAPIQNEYFYGSKNQLDFFSEYETGKISTATLKEKFNTHYKVNIDSDIFDNAWNAMLFDFPEKRIKFINELSKKYRIFLLSNINEIHLNKVHQIYKKLEFEKNFESLFENVYYSHTVGIRKPDEKLFNLILHKNNLKAENTLFIDDSIQHIEGAKRIGLKVHHHAKGNELCDLSFNF